jgi:hypothetical protein
MRSTSVFLAWVKVVQQIIISGIYGLKRGDAFSPEKYP